MTDSKLFFDENETRSAQDRNKDLLIRLRDQLTHAKANTPYYREHLKDVDVGSIGDLSQLQKIAVTRKSELKTLQKNNFPFGGMTAVPAGELQHVFLSPGPIYDPEPGTPNYWRLARAMWAAGVRPGEIVYNTFSYHFTPAGFMVDSAAKTIGCAVFPAGIGQTEMQAQTISELRPGVYAGTPSFLKIILEKADELNLDVSSITKALVSGEALLPATRKFFSDRKIETRQTYATADIGLIAFESIPDQGLIIDEDVLVEIVRPGTDETLPDGQVGEVVVTTFSKDYPLIRFGTGDLSMIIEGQSACGRTNRRLKGWMGRADQTAKVKGMFVHPEQIEKIVKRHKEVLKARLVIEHDESSNDLMTLHCESSSTDEVVQKQVVESIREVTKLKGSVKIVSSGSLPNDGKVIDDLRKFD